MPEASGGPARPAAAVVDLSAIRHNVAYLDGLTPPGCRFMAVVKAGAYGHGDLEVARAALDAGAQCLGVALVEEAERLRSAGFDCPVYLLFEPPPTAAGRALSAGVTCSVYTGEFARALSDAARSAGVEAGVHVKVDTGMRRVGIYPDSVTGFFEMLAGLPALRIDGIYTHFAVATEPEDPFTDLQMDLFEAAAARAAEVLGRDLEMHAANSAGVMAFPRSHYDMVRVGIAMLGMPPAPGFTGAENLRPALSVRGEVAFVKRVAPGEGVSYGLTFAPGAPTYIASIPLGYADGLSRIQNGKAEVLIGGRRRPVVGVICMDMCMVDLGDEPVPPGTPFTLIGRQEGAEITADEVARKLGTINYEVTCMLSPRLPRIYIDGEGRET